jgi:hypothetical protein
MRKSLEFLIMNRHDIAEILLKVALNTINLNQTLNNEKWHIHLDEK